MRFSAQVQRKTVWQIHSWDQDYYYYYYLLLLLHRRGGGIIIIIIIIIIVIIINVVVKHVELVNDAVQWLFSTVRYALFKSHLRVRLRHLLKLEFNSHLSNSTINLTCYAFIYIR